MVKQGWHLSKIIPIGLFIALLGLAFRGGFLVSQVNANSVSIVKLDKGVEMMYEIKSSVARIEGALGIKK